MLSKTPYSYVTRAAADVSGPVNYATSDWSVELAVDLPAGGFIGDIGEIIRHGQRECGFYTARTGWTIHASFYGYSAQGGWIINCSVMGNAQQASHTDYITRTGRVHLVMTWKQSTGTLKWYANGVLAGTSTNAGVILPAAMPGELAIGGANKKDAGYTPAVGGIAMPEFDMHFARMFNGELTGTNAADLYARWNGTGRTDLPAGVSPSVVLNLDCLTQAGDAAGGPGTGWLKDTAGGNHLKIVDTAAIVGGTQATVLAPSGAVRIASPANGATGVSGAATIRADGQFGGDAFLQYYIEIDTVNSFNSGNLRNSGWTLSDGQWTPRLAPSTTYYVRTKAREGNKTGIESSWSSTVSFTTRAAATFYARPKTTPGTYGAEDGSSYAAAFNGLRHNGYKDGLQAAALRAQCNTNLLAPGDTVYLCDKWGLLSGATTTLYSTYPENEWVTAQGLAAHPVNIRLDHGTYPGSIYHFYKYTGAYNWVSEGGGVFSTTTYVTTEWIGVDDGTGKPDTGTAHPESQPILTLDGTMTLAAPGFYYSGGKMFVRMPDGLSPANRLWYLVGTVETFKILPLGCKYVRFQGGAWYGATPMDIVPAVLSTFVTLAAAKFKYSTGEYGFYMSQGFDDWTFDDVEISYMRNAIYGVDTPIGYLGRTADRVTVKNFHIHHIGAYGWSHKDGHAVGWQNGNGWVIDDGLAYNCGTAIEQWGFPDKFSRDNKVRRNVVLNVTKRNTTFGGGISFTNGGVQVGNRTGNEILHNIVFNTDGPGLHYSVGDAANIIGNLVMNCGLNLAIDSDLRHCINLTNIAGGNVAKATITDNVMVNPEQRFLRVGGSGDLSQLVIDRNVYHDPGGAAGDANRIQCAGYLSGAPQSFTAWKAGGTFDQNSVWQDPLTAVLPVVFDSQKVNCFVGVPTGDINNDTGVSGADLTALQAALGGPRPALERYVNMLATYYPISPPGGGSSPGPATGGGRSALGWSLFFRK